MAEQDSIWIPGLDERLQQAESGLYFIADCLKSAQNQQIGRRELLYLLRNLGLGSVAVAVACSPRQEIAEAPTATPQSTSTATRAQPTATSTPELYDRPGSTYMELSAGKYWYWPDWAPNFPKDLTGMAASFRPLFYEGESIEDFGGLQYLDFVCQKFEGFDPDTRGKLEKIAYNPLFRLKDLVSNGHCADNAFMTGYYPEPQSYEGETYWGLPVNKRIKIELLMAYVYQKVKYTLIPDNVGVPEWIFRWNGVPKYQRMAYPVELKPGPDGSWYGLGIAIDPYKRVNGKFYYKRTNLADSDNPEIEESEENIAAVYKPFDEKWPVHPNRNINLEHPVVRKRLFDIVYKTSHRTRLYGALHGKPALT